MTTATAPAPDAAPPIDRAPFPVELDRAALAALCERARIPGPSDVGGLAAHLGMHRTTVARVLDGQSGPGTPFIAAVLTRIPRATFPRLFTVHDS